MAGSSKSRNRLSTCLRVLLSLRKVPARKAGTLIRIRSHSNRRNANMEGVGRYGDDTSLIGAAENRPIIVVSSALEAPKPRTDSHHYVTAQHYESDRL